MVDVIILNGGSSSGKTSIAKSLQCSLPTPWLRFSIDDLVDAMPEALLNEESGIQFGDDGSESPGEEFRTLESAWMHGIGEMVRRGAKVIIDDVFLGGIESQRRWETSLKGLQVLWIGVFCDPEVASVRELERGDRAVGMAESQAKVVHIGIEYDLKVDSTETTPEECARFIVQRVTDS